MNAQSFFNPASNQVAFSSVDDDCNMRCNNKIKSVSSSTSATSQISGWGSAESRKSYACLKSLADDTTTAQPSRQIRSDPIVGEAWGYFVDTIED